jgi:transposase InsO family protein
MKSTNKSVRAWGSFPIKCLGEYTCSVTYQGCTVVTTFLVVKLPSTEGNLQLLAPNLCKQLGVFEELCSVKGEINNEPCAVLEYRKIGLFSGTGVYKNYECEIHMAANVPPISCAPRRLPLSMIESVRSELNKMQDEGVIIQVDQPTEWCSPIVIVKKRNGNIRVCVDYRNLNKAVQRNIFQIPTFEDLTASIQNAKYFSLLDCANGYWQIKVSKKSQSLLTFGTPFGRYTYTRLPFGLKSSPEVFQKVMCDLLSGLPGTISYVDDILIYGSTIEEHDFRLKNVLHRLHTNGITLNESKCLFRISEVNFLGHKISEKGIQPSPEKIAAIQKMEMPQTLNQLQSFLGLVTYVGHRFIPHFSSIARPLHSLATQGQTKLKWDCASEKSFSKIIKEIAETTALTWYDPNKPCYIQTDASGIGLGAVLLQNHKPIAFASRCLTQTECRYSQLEKEFLGIVFGLTRFHRLILGSNCVLKTDHKPIINLMEKPIDALPLRLQRWMLKIQVYDVKYQHIAGNKNVLADALSRNAISESDMLETEETVCFILLNVPLNLQDVAKATSIDPLLQKIKDAIMNNWKTGRSKQLHPYYGFRDEMSIKWGRDGKLFTILRNNKLLIPTSLKNTVLELLHEGHVGMKKMKEICRTFAFWTGFTSDIEEYVKKCTACTVFQMRSDKMPLATVAENSTRIAWHKIAIDLTGPSTVLKGKTLLTIIDYYSRFPEVIILNEGSSKEIVKALTGIFARFGIPCTLVSDNGSVFRSNEFESFLKGAGITHVKSSNYFPQSNGLIERFHRTLKLRLRKISYGKEIILEDAINRVLYDIRSTPNDVSGATPYSRMFGKPMRTTWANLQHSTHAPISVPRKAQVEYNKVSEFRIKDYKIGDHVFVKKGQHEKGFQHPAVITNKKSAGVYEIEFNNGMKRVYNQRMIKPTTNNTTDATPIEAHWAYDTEIERPVDTRTAQDMSTRYNLRPRTVPLHVYRD